MGQQLARIEKNATGIDPNAYYAAEKRHQDAYRELQSHLKGVEIHVGLLGMLNNLPFEAEEYKHPY